MLIYLKYLIRSSTLKIRPGLSASRTPFRDHYPLDSLKRPMNSPGRIRDSDSEGSTNKLVGMIWFGLIQRSIASAVRVSNFNRSISKYLLRFGSPVFKTFLVRGQNHPEIPECQQSQKFISAVRLSSLAANQIHAEFGGLEQTVRVSSISTCISKIAYEAVFVIPIGKFLFSVNFYLPF